MSEQISYYEGDPTPWVEMSELYRGRDLLEDVHEVHDGGLKIVVSTSQGEVDSIAVTHSENDDVWSGSISREFFSQELLEKADEFSALEWQEYLHEWGVDGSGQGRRVLIEIERDGGLADTAEVHSLPSIESNRKISVADFELSKVAKRYLEAAHLGDIQLDDNQIDLFLNSLSDDELLHMNFDKEESGHYLVDKYYRDLEAFSPNAKQLSRREKRRNRPKKHSGKRYVERGSSWEPYRLDGYTEHDEYMRLKEDSAEIDVEHQMTEDLPSFSRKVGKKKKKPLWTPDIVDRHAGVDASGWEAIRWEDDLHDDVNMSGQRSFGPGAPEFVDSKPENSNNGNQETKLEARVRLLRERTEIRDELRSPNIRKDRRKLLRMELELNKKRMSKVAPTLPKVKAGVNGRRRNGHAADVARANAMRKGSALRRNGARMTNSFPG